MRGKDSLPRRGHTMVGRAGEVSRSGRVTKSEGAPRQRLCLRPRCLARRSPPPNCTLSPLPPFSLIPSRKRSVWDNFCTIYMYVPKRDRRLHRNCKTGRLAHTLLSASTRVESMRLFQKREGRGTVPQSQDLDLRIELESLAAMIICQS